MTQKSRCSRPLRVAALLVAALSLLSARSKAGTPDAAGALPDTGVELYRAACAACHGAGGQGAPAGLVGFDVPLPDFTDCNFVSREADADWSAVVREGGPARGFSEIMPAFGDALTEEQIQNVVTHIKNFSDCEGWPRGELNLPRALFTTKAFPEDELVLSTTLTTDGLDKLNNKLIYERRIGPTTQVEFVLPFGWNTVEEADGDTEWTSGVGDLALAAKQVLFHDLGWGSIVSLGGEVALPTGDEDEGLGEGTTILEPYVAFGQLLPVEFFLQGQVGAKFPTREHHGYNEAFWRGLVGRTFALGAYESSWSPMVEFLGSQNLERNEDTLWDLVPQLQVSLNKRQHVRLGLGTRIPLNHTDERGLEFIVYLMWDVFDGGFFDGW